jgi:hypothetical protein
MTAPVRKAGRQSGKSVAVRTFLNRRLVDCAILLLQDPDNVLNGNAQGYIVGQIFNDVFQVRVPLHLL